MTSVPVAMPQAACAEFAIDFAANISALSCERKTPYDNWANDHSCVPAEPVPQDGGDCGHLSALVERGSKCTSLDVGECDGSYFLKSNGRFSSARRAPMAGAP